MTGRGQFVPWQTNTALFAQMHLSGHAMDDIMRVRNAYRLSCFLFNGRYRKTERPFICHAVGVASVAANFERDIDFIIAGMLHAAYDSGQFPDGRIGKRTTGHADLLREHIGERAERLIVEASAMTLHAGRPEELAEKLPIAAESHDGLFLALAHEIDDVADGGVMLARKYGDSPHLRLRVCAELARDIGRPELAGLLEHHAIHISSYEWMAPLAPEKLRGFLIAPNMPTYVRLRKAEFRGEDVRIQK